MSDLEQPVGSIVWADLTVPDANAVRQFYEAVVGWTPAPVDMQDYMDFCMNSPEDGSTIAGICHARGENADLPAQWLMYIRVHNLQRSMDRCTALGGQILQGPRQMGSGSWAVIQDPAGAVAALIESPQM